MARIKNRNTAPELALRRALWKRGLRYRLHSRVEGVRPDLTFLRQRVAVFIDGCFWHGCPDHYVKPRSRQDFWATKLRTNVLRDRAQTIVLELKGWRILRFWEHQIACELNSVTRSIYTAVSRRTHNNYENAWVVTEVETLSEDGRLERRRLEDLRNPQLTRVEERLRTTKKW
jgi:DNA mismatch endonuclease, patch repair protein